MVERDAAAPIGPAVRRPDPPRGTLTDRLLAWRDRLLSSRRFQHLAARFPPTRWIARRRARALFDLVAGFTYSQVLLACVRLRLFESLLERPRTLVEIARLTALDDDTAGRLLAAAVALRLVERRRGDRYGLGPLGAPLAGNRAIASMVEHHEVLYADLADPVALLRGRGSQRHAYPDATRLGAVWGYAANDASRALGDAGVDRYSTLMTESQPLVADLILDAYPFARHRCLLDVGGGEGGFAIAAARRHPALRAMTFDLPSVAARARERFVEHGLADRIRAFGGDFIADPLPAGADLITLVRVVHDHDDARAAELLRAVHAALPDGGVLLLAEPMSGTRGAEPMGDAYFGMYLMAMGSGRPRSAATLRAMLLRAGFRHTRVLGTAIPLQARVIVAEK